MILNKSKQNKNETPTRSINVKIKPTSILGVSKQSDGIIK